MTKNAKKPWLIILLFLSLTVLYLRGIPSVPFHPDESTQVYMSDDLRVLFQDAKSLSYSPGEDMSPKMRYRAIDAPITRYLIGAATIASKSHPQDVDWDWTLDWESNLSNGAYPGESNLLNISRVLPTTLLAISCVFFFLAMKKVLPLPAAFLAVLLLGLNPLVLLHARRAMSEAALLFGVCIFLWALTRDNINPWLIGLSLAAAFNAKQSGAFLIPVGIIAVALNLDEQNRLRILLTRWIIVLGTILVITFLLNPYYWDAPIPALQTGLTLRTQLTQAQVADYLGGNRLTLGQKSISLLNNLYLSGPVFAETDNYAAALKPMIAEYQNFLLHRGAEGMVWGAIQLVFAGSGVYLLLSRITTYSAIPRRSLLLLITSTISVAAGIIIAFQLPWQRYVIPLVPFSAFWIAFGLSPVLDIITSMLQQRFPVKNP